VISADGEPQKEWSDLVSLIRKSPNKRIQLAVEREGVVLEVPIVVGGLEEGGIRYGRIGAAVKVPEAFYDEYRVEVRLGPLEAIGASVVRCPYSCSKCWDEC